MAGIRFLTNEASKVEGLGYPGVETFKGSPYTSCARETGQNSRDAMRGSGPVRVSFDMLLVKRQDIPFADELQHSIQCCLEAPQNEKTKAHLERALTAISAPVVKILRISDINTTGLTGPIDDPGSVFTALVKGDGITNKPDETSAGSFGIGKNAAFAISELQTVIYSTCYEDADNVVQFAAQGRLRLISHNDGERKCSAEGYWGDSGFRAIEDPAAVPEWMAREEIGTSIYAMGFDERDHWASRMTLSLVANFFVAIDRGQIEFVVDGSVINSTSLDTVLENEGLEALAREHDQLAELDRARRLLLCIRSEAATRHGITISGLGNFTLHLLVSEQLPREVHVLRNGIYITDNFAKFSQPMRQFPGTREFIAVLEPALTDEGRAPSALLKQLENPAHDAFEPDRIIHEKDRALAREQIKKLISEVRKIIRSVAKIDEVQNSRLDELSSMFADTGTTRDEGREDEERDPDAYIYQEPRRGTRRQATGATGKGKAKKRGGTGRSQVGSRTGESRKTQRRMGTGAAVPLDAIRSTARAGDPTIRSVWFTPTASGNIELALEASGLTDDVSLDVQSSSPGTVSKGRMQMSVRAGQRVQLEITLTEPFAGPVELSAVKFTAAEEKEPV
ncbi:hypothetical protein [Rhizobium lusitanum]|uniref:Asp-tRNA(Asn)/Glu-tRNA(Gln) amidotransferase C subunit n=1 Tax=Rhizobium lusitanum TaxID=293958 RepID=A0A7X0IXB2_9HYPH|nr:hypothetical protein [Rhizobium lusitanum]MBB6488854.1 Asp-tRNA(Asn)/Glu-tRNA(Gln) amidotransferase C subunit [Rhizobium lusitanum]